MWVLDKLILSKALGYDCGPVGADVKKPGYYIVRPVVNAFGLGIGTSYEYIEKSTDHLTKGYFWCEFFEGRHLSIDYYNGKPILSVEGIKEDKLEFVKWKKWVKTNDVLPLPNLLKIFVNKYDYINCEFIGKKLIEVHFRRNPDFKDLSISEFIPVWEDYDKIPEGYRFLPLNELNGRIGAFVK
jgi:hypothetical protein